MVLFSRMQKVFQVVKEHFSLEICEQERMSARYIQLNQSKNSVSIEVFELRKFG